jgi:hypothetical protein
MMIQIKIVSYHLIALYFLTFSLFFSLFNSFFFSTNKFQVRTYSFICKKKIKQKEKNELMDLLVEPYVLYHKYCLY